MEIKPIYIVSALLILFVGLLLVSSWPAPKPEDKSLEAAAIFLKAVSLGENASGYLYEYSEFNDGFPENYTLTFDGVNSAVEVTSPLSKKKVYFMQNDTVLCVTFQGIETCSSVIALNETKRYEASMKARLFDNSRIKITIDESGYKMNRSMQTFSPVIRTKILPGGKECSEISFVMDYSNITLAEMSRFGISQGSPTHFETTECINNETGVIFEYRFNYTLYGKTHESRFVLGDVDFTYKNEIIPPELNGSALEKIYEENAYKVALMKCYQKSTEEKEKCIAILALTLKSSDLCAYAEARRDRCLVSLIPVTGDIAICPTISAPEFKDDCFIELAGFTKNDTWCAQVLDATKNKFCLNISMPLPLSQIPDNATVEQPPANDSGPIPDAVRDIFDSIDRNETDIAKNASSNQTGGS